MGIELTWLKSFNRIVLAGNFLLLVSVWHVFKKAKFCGTYLFIILCVIFRYLS